MEIEITNIEQYDEYFNIFLKTTLCDILLSII